MRSFKWRLSRFALIALPIIAGCTFSGPPKEEKTEVQKIVVAKDASPWQAFAIEELKHYLKLMAGREIPVEEIQPTLKRPEKGNIYLGVAAKQVGLVGDSDISTLGFDGYALACKDGASGVYGEKGAGVLYGAYRLLEELGWKYYGPDCEMIPQTACLPSGNILVKRTPPFELRSMSPAYGGDFYYKNMRGFALTRLGFSPEFPEKKLSFVPPVSWGLPDDYMPNDNLHTTVHLIPKEILSAHPEYYAHDQKRTMIEPTTEGHLRHICFSNPEVIQLFKSRVNDWITHYPYGKYYSVAQGDGSGWCECENCKALDPVKAERQGEYTPFLTDRNLYCVNQVADYIRQRHPDKTILTLAYTKSTETPPLKLKPSPNVGILLCPYSAGGAQCQSHDLHCPLNSDFLRNFEGWRKMAPDQLYVFDYPMNYGKIYAPFFSHDAMVSKIRFYHANHIKGLWYCGMPRLLGGLFCYIQGKLLWNPELTDAEIAKLEDEYLSAYYGQAAGEMKRLLSLQRKINCDQREPAHQGCDADTGTLAREDYLPEAYTIMDAAEKSVEKDPILLRRVKYEKVASALWLDLDTCFTSDLTTRLLRLGEFIRIVREDRDSFHGFSPSGMDDWFKNKYMMPEFNANGKDWLMEKSLDELVLCKNGQDIQAFIGKHIKRKSPCIRDKDGLAFPVDGFLQSGSVFAPQNYAYLCTSAYATGVYGGGKLSVEFDLEPEARMDTSLIIEGLDDDKAGKTKICVTLNDTIIFSGENQASETKWTTLSFPVSGKLLKQHNKLVIGNPENGTLRQKWFLFRKVNMSPIHSNWQTLNEWNFSDGNALTRLVYWHDKGSSAELSLDAGRKTPNGNASMHLTVSEKLAGAPISAIQLWVRSGAPLSKGVRYKASMWLMSSRQQVMLATMLAENPGYPVPGGAAGSKELLIGAMTWTPVVLDFVSGSDYQENTRILNLSLATVKGDQFWIGDIKFERHCK